jgi:uncharacterized protein YjbI with pentapeptide repeats
MANYEHVALLKKGVDAWNEWRGQNPDIRPDLGGANLSEANLSAAYLGRANLAGANLSAVDSASRVGFRAALLFFARRPRTGAG